MYTDVILNKGDNKYWEGNKMAISFRREDWNKVIKKTIKKTLLYKSLKIIFFQK